MGWRKPPPRIMEPDEERRQQEFLERAAPIVLEDPIVDWHRWQMLARLAAQLDLSTTQLRALLEELRQRGVIREIRYEPPHPPPLPDHVASATTGQELQENDEDFRLKPPPRVDRAKTPPKEPSLAERQRDFHEQAAATMARFGGLTGEARLQLARIARELNLTQEQASAALAELHPAEQSPADESSSEPAHPNEHEVPMPATSGIAEEQLDDERWRVPNGEVVRPPLPPAEAFNRELDEAIRPRAHQRLDWPVQRQWLERGVAVHRLAPVFAFHLIQDAAARHDCELADPAGHDANATEETTLTETPRWQTFLDRAAEILAEHRGLNPRSRVMLMALADELGLTSEQAQRALAWLQASDDREERRRSERRQSFRHHVERVLEKLRRGMVTAHTMSLLVNAAHQRFGLPSEEAERVVHEVAHERNMPVALRDDVERHVRHLVTESLQENGSLDRDSYERLVAEGIRWGMPRRLTERVIEDQVERELQKRVRRRTVSRWALGLASAVIAVCLCFLTWSVLENQYGLPAPEMTSRPTPPTPAVPTNTIGTDDQDDSWWDEELALAMARARIEFPMLRRPLQLLASSSAQRRRSAYEDLVDFLLNKAASDDQRNSLLDLLSICAVLDPDEENAVAIVERLIHEIPTPDQPLVDDPEAYERMFLGLQGAVRTLLAAKNQQPRDEHLAEALSDATGITLDPGSLSADAASFYQAALAERLFRSLIAVAATDTVRAKSLYPVIASQALEHLPRGLQDKLTAEFLATLLASDPNSWESFQDELTGIVNSPDLLAASRLIDLFETTTHGPLREFLGEAFLERIGPSVSSEGGITVVEVAEQIRQALGISRPEQPDERRKWLNEQARTALEVSPDALDPTIELPMMIDHLGRLSAMACALTQGESGWPAFDQLRNDDQTLTPPMENEETPTDSPTRSNRRVDSIGRTLDRISHPLAGPATRALALQSIADQVDSIPDLPPRQAERLADYLLKQKTIEEHRRVLALAPQLAEWKSLRLAIADGLSSATMPLDQLQSLVAALLGNDVEIRPGPAGKQAVQLLLLKSVLEDLGRKPSEPTNPWSMYDQLRDRMAQRYELLAAVLRVTGTSADKGPASILTTLISEYGGESPTREDTDTGEPDVRNRLRAAQFAATDSLRLTVALQHLWLETISASLAGQYPKDGEQIAAVMDDLNKTVHQTDHIAKQLFANQRTELRLWLLAMEHPE